MPLQNIDNSDELAKAELTESTDSSADSATTENEPTVSGDSATAADASDAELKTDDIERSVDSDEDTDCEQISLAIPTPEAEAEETSAEPVTKEEASGLSGFFKEAPPYDPDKPRHIDGRFDFIELLIFTLAAVFVLTTFLFRHSIVDGNSMQNTLQDKEVLIISGLFYTPERYDIVVLEDYSTGLDHPIVKRVIAVGGETVRITADGKIFVNGEEIRSDFVFTDEGDIDGDGVDDYKHTPMTYTVPEGKIFVLGDHRNDSYDSRAFKAVDANTVLGKVLFRIYPFDRFGDVYGEEVSE